MRSIISLVAELIDFAVRWQQPFNNPLHVPCNNPLDNQQTRKNSQVPPPFSHLKSRSASPNYLFVFIFFCVHLILDIVMIFVLCLNCKENKIFTFNLRFHFQLKKKKI